VFGLHAAGAGVESGAGKAFNAEEIETDRGANDVNNGVNGADFVEMNFFDGDIVDFSFGLAEAAEDFAGVFGGARSERCAVDHFQDVRKMAMMMRVASFDVNFCGGNGFAFDAFGGDGPAVEMELAQLGFEGGEFEAGVDEGAENHVAADAGETVEVSEFHWFTSQRAQNASRRKQESTIVSWAERRVKRRETNLPGLRCIDRIASGDENDPQNERRNVMRRLFVILAFIFACVTLPPASAQTTDAGYDTLSPSLASVAKSMNATIRRNIADAAEEMPAEEYSFRPTPQVRSFGQIIGHLTEANFFFCSQAADKKYPVTTDYEKITDKATLVKDLNDSLAYCDAVYAATTDANFLRPVKVSYGSGSASSKTVRGAVLMFNTAHNNEHYGNLVVYMRLKGHVPPSTARARQQRE